MDRKILTDYEHRDLSPAISAAVKMTAKPGLMTLPEERDLFLAELGRAIVQWARVENQLTQLVLACVEPHLRPSIYAGFVNLEGFRQKLRFAEGIISKRFAGSPWADQCEDLLGALSQKSRLRNKLAHKRMELFVDNSPGRRVFLIDWEDKDKPTDGGYCLGDLLEITQQFRQLTIRLSEQNLQISGQRVQHVEFRLSLGGSEPPSD